MCFAWWPQSLDSSLEYAQLFALQEQTEELVLPTLNNVP